MILTNQFKAWKKVRYKGKKHFIIFHGILGWGLGSGFLFWLIRKIEERGLTFLNYFNDLRFFDLFITFTGFMIVGMLFAYFLWEMNEGKY